MAKRRKNKRQVGAQDRGSGPTARDVRRKSPGWEVGPGHAYPLTFRVRVVEQVTKNGISLLEASRVFGPSAATIAKWVETFGKGGRRSDAEAAEASRAQEEGWIRGQTAGGR